MTAESREALEEAKKLFFILLGIDITIAVVVGFNAFSTIGILKEIASGARVANESLISSLTFWDNFSKLLLLTLIGVGFGLVKWLNSCYRFAKDSLGATGFVNERWTGFGWIIPFFNFVKPYQVINEIFKAGAKNYTTTDGWKREAGSGLLLTWWIFWAVTHFIGTLFSQQLLKGVTSNHLTVQQAINLIGMQVSLCVVSVIIAGLWFVVVNHLTQRLFDRASKSGTPVKAPPEFNASPNTRPENSSTARLDGTEEVAWTNWRTTPNSMAEILPAPTLRSTANADIKNTQGVPTAMINDPPIPPDVEAFYDMVGKELEDGKPDRPTWTRAFAEADGDDAKARASYIRLRVARLMAAYEAEMATKAEGERLAANEAERAEAKRLAVIDAEMVAKADVQRFAAMELENMAKAEAQRLADIAAEKVAEDQAESLKRSRVAKAEADRLAVIEAEKGAKVGAEPSGMANKGTCPFCGEQLGWSSVVCPECNRMLSLKAPDAVIPTSVEEASKGSGGERRVLASDIVMLLAAADDTVVSAIQQYDKLYSAATGLRIRTEGEGSGLGFLLISNDGVIVRKNRREMIKVFEAQLSRLG